MTLSLAVFSWLLTLHSTAAGWTYAAYGGVYVSVAILLTWLKDKQTRATRTLTAGDHSDHESSLATHAGAP